MVTWVIFLTIGLVIGIAAGMFIGQLDDMKRKQREELQKKLEHAEQELLDHKRKVTEHFVKTSTLVNNMTESYKAIHNHLSIGAETLCDSQLDVGKLNISEVNIIEKQDAVNDQTVETTNTQTPDDKIVESKPDAENESIPTNKQEEHESAERVLAEKIIGAGFGGVDLEATESSSILGEESRVVAKANPETKAPDTSKDSSVNKPSDHTKENEDLTAIPNGSKNLDVEKKDEAAANRIVH